MAASRIDSAFEFSPDSWLAEMMGVAVFKLGPCVTGGEQTSVAVQMRSLAGHADAFYYAKLSTADVRTCASLMNAGFAVVDTGITFSWAGKAKPDCADAITVDRVVAGAEDEAIPAIAERCFRWSRFHLDPHISSKTANLIKRRWMESYVQGKRGSALYRARSNATTVGFLGVLETVVDGREVAVIDLVGVAPEHQGRGIGPSLMRSFIDDWNGKVAELRVGTQVANIRSLRFYERTGFRSIDSNYVLHAHYRRGEVVR